MEEYVSPAMIQIAGNGESSDESLGIAILGVVVIVVAWPAQQAAAN